VPPFPPVLYVAHPPLSTPSPLTPARWQYAGAIAYVGLPYLGLGDAVSASSVVGFAAGLPLWAKLGAKTALAVPFAYHTINGVRHLIWDTGRAYACLAAPPPPGGPERLGAAPMC
jgi:succinate dehydrogenase/fumarate reductase cytochrome b subunit